MHLTSTSSRKLFAAPSGRQGAILSLKRLHGGRSEMLNGLHLLQACSGFGVLFFCDFVDFFFFGSNSDLLYVSLLCLFNWC